MNPGEVTEFLSAKKPSMFVYVCLCLFMFVYVSLFIFVYFQT